MSFLVNSNVSTLAQAQQFVALGWSVIPLMGSKNPEKHKQPALPSWKVYQERLPFPQELEMWFKQYDAMGVVLGRVSGLAAVDIDDPIKAALFRLQFPDLCNTLTISSGNRGLPHYYFRIADDLPITAMTVDGIELRCHGQYVVAPNTTIGDKTWSIERNLAPRFLTKSDLNRLVQFIRQFTHVPEISAVNPALERLKAKRDSVTLNGYSLTQHYKHKLHKGRNNALFETSRFARDCGWLQPQVEHTLLQIHINAAPPSQHIRETANQRKREGLRTIASVFSHPANRNLKPHDENPDCSKSEQLSQLPNAVREKLLQLKLDNVARILDGLLMMGFQAGQQFTVAHAYEVLAPLGIGRNVIFAVLKVALENGKQLFERFSPHTPLSKDANAAERCADDTKQCLFGRVAKVVKNRGRAANVFLMPSIEALCALLQVTNQGGDRLMLEDLKLPSTYRAALHAALIERRPGQYPRAWQAERLGISEDSCRRYEKQTHVEVVPVFQNWEITWQNVEHMLDDDCADHKGRFMQDEKGKRYPALRSLACKLLHLKKHLHLRIQDANYYRTRPQTSPEKPAPPLKENMILTKTPSLLNTFSLVYEPVPDVPTAVIPAPEKAYSAANFKPVRPDDVPVLTLASAPDNALPVENTGKKALDHTTAKKPRKPRLNLDLMEKLYQTLRDIDPQKSITRKTAKTLVKQFDNALIERGLMVLSQRNNIQNRAGFLIVWLRSESRKI